MTALWLARLSHPDILKPINDLATKVQKWTKDEDKKLLRLIQYLQHSKHYRLCGSVDDPSEDLYLELFCDADFGGNKSIRLEVILIVLKGPNATFPETSVSRSTTESEVVSLALSDQAAIIVVEKGYSPKLRHIPRTHNINMSGLSELLGDPDIKIEFVDSLEQLAGIFTKALQLQKWYRAPCL